jgi:arylsulfatase A-like enzyme
MYGGYEQLSEDRTLVSEVFDQAGYQTAGFHSNAYLNPEFGYGRGWDMFFDSMSDSSSGAKIRQWVKNNLSQDSTVYNILAWGFETVERHAGANIGSAYIDADDITDRAIDWVEDVDGQRNFLWVHYMDVHHPYVPPEEHQLAFRDDPIGEREAVQLRRKFLENPEAVTDVELDDIIDLYDAEIRFTDAEIARLLDAINNCWTDSNIIITADHGEEFREHGQFSHSATFYDELLHVPMIFDNNHYQGRYEELVGLLDISPTLVDTAGVNLPDNFYGHSLQSLLSKGEWPRSEIIGDWSSSPDAPREFVYRDHDWKYIKRPETEELYKLESDPDESNNLLGSEESERIIDDLREIVEQHESVVDSTYVNVDRVEMDEGVKQQLQDLGYKE